MIYIWFGLDGTGIHRSVSNLLLALPEYVLTDSTDRVPLVTGTFCYGCIRFPRKYALPYYLGLYAVQHLQYYFDQCYSRNQLPRINLSGQQ